MSRTKCVEWSTNRTFYTDGSNTNDSTGFGVFSEFYSAAHKLQIPFSIYVAELAPIHYALEWIATLPSHQYFIFTDRLSSIKAIRSMRPVKHSTIKMTKMWLASPGKSSTEYLNINLPMILEVIVKECKTYKIWGLQQKSVSKNFQKFNSNNG